jgi:DinB superfamily
MTERATRPALGEFAPDFARYIDLVPAGDVVAVLADQLKRTQAIFEPLSEARSLTVHPPYAWTLKQVLGHVTDGERVFGYRALRMARQDATPLPGFDENLFMNTADFNSVPMADLLDEFACLRRSHLLLLNYVSAEGWQWKGTVLGNPATCRAMAFVMAGHMEHHLAIVKKRLGG